MFDHNPFRDAKNYWKSYYTTITEGWNDEVEDVTGFKWIEKDHEQYDPKHDPQGHGHHFYNEETGEKMSQDEVMKLYDSKKKKSWKSGDPDSDPDMTKPGEPTMSYAHTEYRGNNLMEHIPLDDDEGGMAMSELKALIEDAHEIHDMLQANTQLEGWVQTKISKAKDYVSAVRDYLKHRPGAME